MTDANFWKDRYKTSWEESSAREAYLANELKNKIGREVKLCGLGAGSSDYISGSAKENNHTIGDADLMIEGTNIYIEVTGPLTRSVTEDKPLWFRPDKIDNNAISSSPEHETFLAHNLPRTGLWRIIHVDEEFIADYRRASFYIRSINIRGAKETFCEIPANYKHNGIVIELPDDEL